MDWLKKLFSAFRPKPVPASDSGSLEDDIQEMLTSHGVKDIRNENGWVLADGELPALRADYWINSQTEERCTVNVDFTLAVRSGRRIIECYADFGSDLCQATGKNLYKFCAGALHVFLSAYWDHHEPDQVDKETWHANDRQWDAYLSSMINYVTEEQKAGFPKDYMARLEQAICDLPLSEPEHWISMFFCNLKNDWTVEVRLDNDIHEGLTQVVREMDWPSADGMYTQRQFILLRQTETVATS
jgi:hypothetical protein